MTDVMDQAPQSAESQQAISLYLLAIRGTLAPPTLEAARAVHNSTAGAPANIAAAQSLGDLSHMVYVPAGGPGAAEGEFLILDIWNSMDGLGMFFANPQVQEQAGQIFTTRDPVVWGPAAGFVSYHLPAPHGRNDRFVAIVRGTVRSQADGRAVHNALVAGLITPARRAGALSHEAYLRMAAPDSPEALEFFAVDVWSDAAGMQQIYGDPAFGSGLAELFTGPPMTSVWQHPAGDWAEW